AGRASAPREPRGRPGASCAAFPPPNRTSCPDASSRRASAVPRLPAPMIPTRIGTRLGRTTRRPKYRFGLAQYRSRIAPEYAHAVPELRHLRYFIAVAEELNFSRAARRLRMAQPPLSVAIRQLEQDIGVSLFVRTSREVRLTEAGEAFLEGARRTLAEAEAAVAAAGRAAAGELGTLRIGYS